MGRTDGEGPTGRNRPMASEPDEPVGNRTDGSLSRWCVRGVFLEQLDDVLLRLVDAGIVRFHCGEQGVDASGRC